MKIKFLLVASLCSVNSDASILDKVSNICYTYRTISLGLAHILSSSAVSHSDNDPNGLLKAGVEEAAALALCGFASQSKKQFFLSAFVMWCLTWCVAKQIVRKQSILLNNSPSGSQSVIIVDNDDGHTQPGSAQPWQEPAENAVNNLKEQIRSIAQTLGIHCNEDSEPDQQAIVNEINRLQNNQKTEDDLNAVSDLENKNLNLKNENENLKNQLLEEQEKNEQLENSLNGQDENLKQLDKLQKQVANLTEQNEQLTQQINENENLQNQVEHIKKENKQLSQNLNEQTAKAQQLEEQIQEKELQIQELTAKNQQRRDEIERVQKENTDLQERVDALTVEIKNIDNIPLRKNYEEALNEIKGQKQLISELQQENEQLKQDNEQKKQELQKQKQMIDQKMPELKESIKYAQQKREELLQINEQLHQQLQNVQEALKSTIQNLLKTIAATKSNGVVIPKDHRKKFIDQYTEMLSNDASKVSEMGVREALKYVAGFGSLRTQSAFGCSDYTMFVGGLSESVISFLQTVVNLLQAIK